MRIVKNNKRISVLGLIKFFAAIAIVYFHTLPTDPSTHWRHLWLLVELFFLLLDISHSNISEKKKIEVRP